jgi:DNA-binding response OmpR family regulator
VVTSADLVLIATADQRLQGELRARLHAVDVSSIVVGDLDAARNAMQRNTFAVALVDLDSAYVHETLDFIGSTRRTQPLTEIIALLGIPDFERSLVAIRQGACDVILKESEQLGYLGPRVVALRSQVQTTLERQQLLGDSVRMNEELLLKLTDSARRIGELRWQLNQRAATSPHPTPVPAPPTGKSTPPAAAKGAPPPIPAPPPAPAEEQAQVLIVEEDGWLSRALSTLLPKSFILTTVISGGSALDTTSGRVFDLALVKDALPDLPGRMVVRNLSAAAPDTMVLLWSPPAGKRAGKVERIDGRSDAGKLTSLIPEFFEPKQIADRLRELVQAQQARRRERKYLADFRTENLDLLRRLADLRKRLRPFEAELGAAAGASGAGSPGSSSGNLSPVSGGSGSFPGGRRG